jgi:adenylate kinase family enzyme
MSEVKKKPTILLMGPPLAGKSTVGARLAQSMRGKLISTGAVIRSYLATASENDALGQHVRNGTMAPAALTDAVFLDAFRLLALDDSVEAVVVDGYPRAGDQIAEAASLFARAGLAPISSAVLLEIDKSAAMARLAGREARPDDAVAMARFDRFAADSVPLVEHFHICSFASTRAARPTMSSAMC